MLVMQNLTEYLKIFTFHFIEFENLLIHFNRIKDMGNIPQEN